MIKNHKDQLDRFQKLASKNDSFQEKLNFNQYRLAEIEKCSSKHNQNLMEHQLRLEEHKKLLGKFGSDLAKKEDILKIKGSLQS